MRTMRRASLIVVTLLVAAACASSGSRASVSSSVITASDLETVPFTNALEVLERHNSVEFRGGEIYLRGRGQDTFENPASALVVVDAARLGGSVEPVLEGIATERIDRIEIMRPAEATTRFGMDGQGGAVVIRTKRGS